MDMDSKEKVDRFLERERELDREEEAEAENIRTGLSPLGLGSEQDLRALELAHVFLGERFGEGVSVATVRRYCSLFYLPSAPAQRVVVLWKQTHYLGDGRRLRPPDATAPDGVVAKEFKGALVLELGQGDLEKIQAGELTMDGRFLGVWESLG